MKKQTLSKAWGKREKANGKDYNKEKLISTVQHLTKSNQSDLLKLRQCMTKMVRKKPFWLKHNTHLT